MSANVGTILLGAAALAEQLTTMIDRFAEGNMTEEQLAKEWDDINSRVAWSEKIMDRALAKRKERGL